MIVRRVQEDIKDPDIMVKGQFGFFIQHSKEFITAATYGETDIWNMVAGVIIYEGKACERGCQNWRN